MRNKTIIEMVKKELKYLSRKLNDDQIIFFNRMYNPNNLDSSINETIDNMDPDKLDHAFTQVERTIHKKYDSRYFLDIRGGCVAIRDRYHRDYDESYPGLHSDTPDVVIYKHGFQENGSWNVSDDDINYLEKKLEELNK